MNFQINDKIFVLNLLDLSFYEDTIYSMDNFCIRLSKPNSVSRQELLRRLNLKTLPKNDGILFYYSDEIYLREAIRNNLKDRFEVLLTNSDNLKAQYFDCVDKCETLEKQIAEQEEYITKLKKL